LSRGIADNSSLRELLDALAAGHTGVEETIQKLRLFQISQLGDFARLDSNRILRKGVPEVIYAPRKTEKNLAAIVEHFLDARGLALVSRLEPERADLLRGTLEASGRFRDLDFDYEPEAGVLAATTDAYHPPETRGYVGLLTAGTSDIPVAEEAALVAKHMGCHVERGYDVGVAGVHRLLEPLSRMIEAGADAFIVVAGMEGALPSVVGGLVDVPVIGVPTSTGYGIGGDGTAALYSILQSCSPGVVAVNIDNGVGAGAAAALIARRRPA
jgi:NCAIR mutase (PurE)-related protein